MKVISSPNKSVVDDANKRDVGLFISLSKTPLLISTSNSAGCRFHPPMPIHVDAAAALATNQE
jgi:hypothetical protein